ncbi:ABC transporter permease [Agriterribacter sp.]|uniref:ABC transporter permease n=1 Tax=Agriterribacter sp. TaxID=2821509 RepID=UPI002CF16BBE|nr:ABC transporter permease [Agriterribacter sp.]HRO45317.1 ABC transporter permease [Agriterribacter sp.]HRQ17122.1 ABC transporter permease [Agriterribacter sp.]
MQKVSSSFFQSAWRRLRKNKGAVFGLCIIALAVLTALFAYFIAPDHSPNANRMAVEIGGRKPGFSMLFLMVRRDKIVEKAGFFERLLNGQDDRYTYIPVHSWQRAGDSIIAEQYIDEGITERHAFYSKDQEIAPAIVVKKTFWLGTDKFGRDILSRLIVGVRVSLAVGLIAVFISLSIGIVLGLVAGYFGGRTDNIIMWFINVVWSIPALLLVFAITLALGKGFWQVFIAVGLTLWVSTARIIRTQVLSIRELQYVEAARALGFTSFRIIFRHILPNVLGPVMVMAASNFASAIVIEAGLSFLGVGVQPPQPSWGLMIKENYNFIITHNPLLAISPGICIMLLVLAFNLLGNGLRDALDVRSE